MIAYDVNLYTRKKKSIADKMLYFLLHYFRYIIVLTQIVVISVFFYRFTVDQDIIDLKEAFRSKQQILVLTVPIIDEAKAIQDSTLRVKGIIDKQSDFQQKYNAIINNVPSDVIISDIDYKKGLIIVMGEGDSTIAVRTYFASLQKHKGFAKVEMEDLNVNTSNKFSFSLKIYEAV